jgi:exopolysaccharide biosynthesis polyprenyl glycosylphosphotransferase
MTSLQTTPDRTTATLQALRARPHRQARLQSTAFWAHTALAVDAAMLAAALGATAFGAEHAGLPRLSLGWLVAFAAICLVAARARGMYAAKLRLDVLDDLRGVITVVSLAAMSVLAVRVLLGADPDDLSVEVFRPWVFAAVYLAAGRIALSWTQTRARTAGEVVRRPTLIVGAGRVGRLLARRLADHPELGLRPIGFLDKEPMDDAAGPMLPVLGASWDLDRLVEDYGVQHVIVTFSTAPHEVLLRLVRRCEDLGVQVSFVPRLFERVGERLTVDHLGGLPLVTATLADPKSWQFAVKYLIDRIVAGIVLLLASPLLLGAMLAVRLSLGRPIFFHQTRIGRDGRPFEMLKLRTMLPQRDGAYVVEPEWLPQDTAPGGVEGEDRRTRVGAFLRRTSIDELPQLINVVRGEMSLVGPRPERPEYVEMFEESVYRYGDRHRVKAGITGWAQVNGLRGQTSLSDRVEWDNHYIENWSLWLDVKIALWTVLSVFRMYRTTE